MTETLLTRVLRHEGFEPKPYQDTEGVWTIGHGLTYLTEDESKYIVHLRLHEIEKLLMQQHSWISGEVLSVTAEMCYQLGFEGCHKFKKMWAALEAENYNQAVEEMLDSKWFEQTPERCNELAEIIGNLA